MAEKFVSDSDVLCLTPKGQGLSNVSLEIYDEPNAVRTGSLRDSFSYVEVYYGGIIPDATAAGFMATGPSVKGVSSPEDATYQSVGFDIFGSVLSVASYSGMPCVAGTFQKIEDKRVGRLFCWDGHSHRPLGNGVDGSILAMASYGTMLVVGGTFEVAYQTQGGGFVRTGNVAAWNGSAWSALGNAKFDGAVTAMVSNGSSLYVAGRFGSVGQQKVDGLARYDGTRWVAVGGGVGGGCVHSIAVNGEFLYIGGSFRKAGNVSAHHLARWDSRQWRALGKLNGDVHGVAVLGPDLFVAGEFTEVDGLFVDYIVRYGHASGAWQKLDGGGANAAVSSLAVVNNCVYFVGSFTALRNAAGEEDQPAHHAGRYCPQPRVQGKLLEGVLTNSTTGPIRCVVASSIVDIATVDALAQSWTLSRADA
jgi:hypothetical protein